MRTKLSERLNELFNLRGESQSNVAKEISTQYGIKIHQTSVGEYLREGKIPTADRLLGLALYFDVSTDYLLGADSRRKQYDMRISCLEPQQREVIETLLSKFEEQSKANNDEEDDEESKSTTNTSPTIYFILAPVVNRIKIGYSGNPEGRISNIMTSSPHELELLGTISGTRNDERELHQRFAHIRKNREWFDATPELVAYIKQATSV